jgi:hypothetical protein
MMELARIGQTKYLTDGKKITSQLCSLANLLIYVCICSFGLKSRFADTDDASCSFQVPSLGSIRL